MSKINSRIENETHGEKSLKENTKLKIMFGVEMALLIVLASALVIKYMHPFDKITETDATVVAQQENEAPVELTPEERAEMLNTADEAIDSLYVTLFPGDYTTSDGKSFLFNADGSTFRGYVDPGKEDEKGTYSLSAKDGINYVTVNAGKTEKIYSFIFTTTGSVELTDTVSGDKYELK